MKRINAKGKSCLIIGDLHIPFMHQDAFKFLAAIKKKYLDKNSLIFSIGDEVDGNQISMHDKDPDILLSPSSELEKCIDIIHMKGGLNELFPKMRILSSNHGDLVYRRAKKGGLPLHYLRELKDVYGVKWSWHNEIMLSTRNGSIYLCHGRSSSRGKLAGGLASSTIQGHYHGLFGVRWYRGGSENRFCCYTGCLIDEHNLAFSYGRLSTSRPILGSVILTKEGLPVPLLMLLDKNNRWTGKLQ